MKAWRIKADIDLGTARTLLRDRDETAPWVACFHAQQAAEKYLKAVLAARGSEPPYTHNLLALQARLPATLALGADVDLATLTTYASGRRYAFSDFEAEPEPTWEDAERALGWATTIGRTVRGWLEAGVSDAADPRTSDPIDPPADPGDEVAGG